MSVLRSCGCACPLMCGSSSAGSEMRCGTGILRPAFQELAPGRACYCGSGSRRRYVGELGYERCVAHHSRPVIL
jgi:hypothetical protein